MRWDLIVPVILYELIAICGVSYLLNWINRKRVVDHSADFVNAGGGLGPVAVAASLSLSALGGGHIIGLAAQAPATGVGTYWYCLSSAIMVAIILCFTGPWYKRMRTPTVKYMFERLYDERVGMIHAGLSAGFLWGVITLEMQSAGTVLFMMTGWNMALCCIVGAVVAVLYVVFAGMKEAAWVNVINAVVMYAGVLVAAIYLGGRISGGWEAINAYYVEGGNSWMLTLAGTSETWRTYILGTIIASIFYGSVNQSGCQISTSAKNVKTLKKACILCCVLNAVFGVFMIAFSLAANSMPEYASYGGPMVTYAMLLDLLPTWIVVWLLAGFFAAILSTIAVCILGFSTQFVNDIVKSYFKPNMDNKSMVKWLRGVIVVSAVGACCMSTLLPSINTSMVWLFAWMLPSFWLMIFGLFWKRSTRAAIQTIVICGVVNCIWSFTNISELFHLEGSNNSIVLLIITLVIGTVLVALDKNAEPALVKLYKKNKQDVIYKG